jgi:hypothetical protein
MKEAANRGGLTRVLVDRSIGFQDRQSKPSGFPSWSGPKLAAIASAPAQASHEGGLWLRCYHSSHHSCLYKTRVRRKCSVPAWLRRRPEFPGKPSHGSRFHGVARNDFVLYEVARRTFEQAMLKAHRSRVDACKHHARGAVRTARALNGCELRTG